MVIADNKTRWNSTFLSLERGLKLYNKISAYSLDNKDELGEDFLLPEDWDILRRIESYLQPFHRTTKQLEGHATDGHHGAIWEALPAMEYLLRHLEHLKQTVPKRDTRIWECVNNSWAKLNEYYNITDSNHAVYAAATLLHPAMRMTYFRKNWIGKCASWIPVMEAKCRDVWETEFLPLALRNTTSSEPEDTFLNDMMGLEVSTNGDEFYKYAHRNPTPVDEPKRFNPINWWNEPKTSFPSLHLYAFDTLAIPAMSAECERVFCSAKKLITPERNRLAEEVIKALSLDRFW